MKGNLNKVNHDTVNENTKSKILIVSYTRPIYDIKHKYHEISLRGENK